MQEKDKNTTELDELNEEQTVEEELDDGSDDDARIKPR